MIKKILKYIIIGVVIYLTILAIEFCCLYSVHGDNTWNYIKEYWDWYKDVLFW